MWFMHPSTLIIPNQTDYKKRNSKMLLHTLFACWHRHLIDNEQWGENYINWTIDSISHIKPSVEPIYMAKRFQLIKNWIKHRKYQILSSVWVLQHLILWSIAYILQKLGNCWSSVTICKIKNQLGVDSTSIESQKIR